MGDEELVQAVRDGRSEVYTALVDRHQARIYRLCYHVCGNAVDAQDLAHDSFVEGYIRLNQLREPARYGQWIRALALNLCRMWYRQRRRFVALTDEQPVPEPIDDEAGYAAVYTGLSRLSADHRLALALHYWEGLPYEDVARFLDVPIGTVMSRLHRARARLKTLMQEGGEEDMPADDDIRGEVEAEIRVLLAMAREQNGAQERLSVILRRNPARLAQLLRDADGEQTLGDIALLLRRLGPAAIQTVLELRLLGDPAVGQRAGAVLANLVGRFRQAGESEPSPRIARRELYLLVERLAALPADGAGKAELLVELSLAAGKDEKAVLLLTNALLCYPDEALGALLTRFWSAANPDDLYRPGDVLWSLCRLGTRFGRELVEPLRGPDARRAALALAGAEALARTLHHEPGRLGRAGWLDLGSVSDEEVLLDARMRRKWAVPLRRDRDAHVMGEIAQAVAPLAEASDAPTRIRAVRTLGLLGDVAPVEPVLAAARHPDRATRLAALRALADGGSQQAVDPLIEASSSPHQAERRAAIEGLGALHAPESLPVVAAALNDPDKDVRRTALSALRGFGEDETAAAVRAASPSPDRDLKAARAMLLSHREAGQRPKGSAGIGIADRVRQGATPAHFISLEAAIRGLPERRTYSENEVTRLIAQDCWDYSSTRRYLVDEGLLQREGGTYELTEAGAAVWSVEKFIAEHYGQG